MNRHVMTTRKLTCIKIVLWAGASAVFLALVACASPPSPSLPPYPDPGIPSADGPDISTGCACKTAPTLVRGPGQGDWPGDATSQANLWTWWTGMYNASNWTKYDKFTNGYNCAGYVWENKGHWVNAFDPYLGTTSGCWKKDSGGTIRLGGGHVCMASYVGKVGRGPLQDHNDDIYGSMPDKYIKVP